MDIILPCHHFSICLNFVGSHHAKRAVGVFSTQTCRIEYISCFLIELYASIHPSVWTSQSQSNLHLTMKNGSWTSDPQQEGRDKISWAPDSKQENEAFCSLSQLAQLKRGVSISKIFGRKLKT